MTNSRPANFLRTAIFAAALLATAHGAVAGSDNDVSRRGVPLATGQYVTPTAPEGAVQQFLNPGLAAYPDFVAGEAVRSQLSPDGKLLAIICAGQNSLDDANGNTDAANSTQYVFLYDVDGANQSAPRLLQAIQQKNAHVGLVWAPDGGTLYAAGGSDDVVYAYTRSGKFLVPATPISLGHKGKGTGLAVQPNASGLGISPDGRTLVVANNYNDSVSVIDTQTATVRYEHDLRPYFGNNEGTGGVAGGTYPFAVAVRDNRTAYVSSDRDREVVVLDISNPSAGRLIKRIKLDGNALGMAFDKARTRLFVAQDNADQVAVIDTATNAVVARIDARAPAGMLNGPGYTGAATFAVTVSPDDSTLFAVNAGSNSIAVIPLKGDDDEGNGKERGAPPAHYAVKGLIPTAYEPHDITLSQDGSWMFIINGKSATGPNDGHLYGNTAALKPGTYPDNAAAAAAARASNQYQFQLERASLVSGPVSTGPELAHLTEQVARNNGYRGPTFEHYRRMMAFLRDQIQHVIYLVKENRTFDQVLGDLNNGSNGDWTLAVFGRAITPNFHNLAGGFVTLDNFMDPGDGSMDGWSWAMAGRVTNTETITQQINYAFVNRGLSYESEGANRNVPVGLGTVAARDAATGGAFSSQSASLPGGSANLLVGAGNHAATDSPLGRQQGYIFNAVLQTGLTVRNYGFLVNNVGPIKDSGGNAISSPFATGIVQVAPLNPALAPLTDVYFRGYDQNYPDLWRYDEWKREFDRYVANGRLPSLSLVRLSHDHTGSFGTALAKVNTPETQQADDDLAVGKLVDAVAHSPYAANTLIIVTEDDCQDGPDHVDSHRATAYVVGPYVKRNAVVSTGYNQASVLRTIEDILGTPHINLYTAYARPMADVFDLNAGPSWTYTAVASTVLASTGLAPDIGVKYAKGPAAKSTHGAEYWANVTRGLDFSDADRVPPKAYNRILWAGLKPGKPYPLILGERGDDDDDDRAD